MRISRPPVWLRVAALGFFDDAAVLDPVLVPIIQVENRRSFALKIGELIVIANLLGAGIYPFAKDRARS